VKNEKFHLLCSLGIATVTTASGPEAICAVLCGAFNDTFYIRPSEPLSAQQQNELVAQGCNPRLLTGAMTAEQAIATIDSRLAADKLHLLVPEIYNSIPFAWMLVARSSHAEWTTLKPEPLADGRASDPSADSLSIHDQLYKIHAACPSYETCLPHTIDIMRGGQGEAIGFSVNGPIYYKNIVQLEILEPEVSLAAIAAIAMSYANDIRTIPKYASQEVRDSLEKAFEISENESIAFYENEHPLNPANPRNIIAQFNPEDYPLSRKSQR